MAPIEGSNTSYDSSSESLYFEGDEGVNQEEEGFMAASDYIGPFTPLMIDTSLPLRTVFQTPQLYAELLAVLTGRAEIHSPLPVSPVVSDQDDDYIISFDDDDDDDYTNDELVGMELDIDEMSYEELLALQDKIGYVHVGLDKLNVLVQLKKREIQLVASACPDLPSECCICLEQYEERQSVCAIDCGHTFHVSCIKKWLMEKNCCPLCNAKALNL